MENRGARLLIPALVLMAALPTDGMSVKRGRNEGTTFVPASNVMGNGTIAGSGGVAVSYSDEGIRFDPKVGAGIGVGSILQISGTIVPYGQKGMGPIEGHVQMTYPGNDKLRFFGMALRADLYLSTALDTISLTADPSKPDYSPYLLPSLVADLDFISKWNRIPLKLYVMAGLADEPQLLHQYRQLAAVLGAEWKMAKHSYYCDAGLSMYRERRHRYNRMGDSRFEQMYAWIGPGGRYRFWNRFSLVGSLRMALYQKLKPVRPLAPGVFGVHVGIEAPIYFKETDTEAIRTLIFAEQSRTQEQKHIAVTAESVDHYGKLGLSLGGKGGETFDFRKEEEKLVREREEIQRKMDEIEELLLEVGDEEQ